MNIFRGSGDFVHAIGILWLLKMAMRGNSSAISAKAQELYLVVFLARYLDLFTAFYSLYNSFMKCFFIFATGAIIYILKCSKKSSSSSSSSSSYSPTHDSFQHWKKLALPSAILALIIALSSHMCRFYQDYWNGAVFMLDDKDGTPHTAAPLRWDQFFDRLAWEFSWMELFWTFSIILESVAMLPQLIMFRSDRFAIKGNSTGRHGRDEILYPIFLFGIYRALYILNWIYRANTERRYRHHYLVYICGLIQVLLYSQFFKLCCKASVCPDVVQAEDEGADDCEQPLLSGGDEHDTDDTNKNEKDSTSTPTLSDDENHVSHQAASTNSGTVLSKRTAPGGGGGADKNVAISTEKQQQQQQQSMDYSDSKPLQSDNTAAVEQGDGTNSESV